MGKVMAFFGIVVVAGALILWKFVGKTEPVQPETTDKGASGTSLKAGERELSTKVSYKNPGGSDEVGFKVVVDASGVITDASVNILAVNPMSKTRQTAFAEGLPQALKGKKLSELSSIDRVGGSSLTTAAFNGALSTLKAEL